MTVELLMMGKFGENLRTALGPGFRLHSFWEAPDREAFLAAEGTRFEGIIGYSGALPVTAAVLDRCPRVRLIANLGVGYESVDMAAARARNITVTNAGATNAPDVAEIAIGLMIDVFRQITVADRHVRAGAWKSRRMPLTRRVSGRPLGILGLGAIGLEVAKRAAAFDMPIAYHNRKPRADVPYRYVDDPVALAREVDVLVAAAPGGPETHHLVGRAVLDALGPEGVFISVGRGSVVDEAALIAALREGRLWGAGLDVFEHEPEVPKALLALPNVVLTPHYAGGTIESMMVMHDMAVRNILAFFAGKPVLTPVM